MQFLMTTMIALAAAAAAAAAATTGTSRGVEDLQFTVRDVIVLAGVFATMSGIWGLYIGRREKKTKQRDEENRQREDEARKQMSSFITIEHHIARILEEISEMKMILANNERRIEKTAGDLAVLANTVGALHSRVDKQERICEQVQAEKRKERDR